MFVSNLGGLESQPTNRWKNTIDSFFYQSKAIASIVIFFVVVVDFVFLFLCLLLYILQLWVFKIFFRAGCQLFKDSLETFPPQHGDDLRDLHIHYCSSISFESDNWAGNIHCKGNETVRNNQALLHQLVSDLVKGKLKESRKVNDTSNVIHLSSVG